MLVRNFKAQTSDPGQVALNWDLPLDFNDTIDELIVTRTITHFPMELFNPDFPNRATDSRPIEIFRGKSIPGNNTGTISVLGNVLTDTAAIFPTNPSLKGRLMRDSSSQVFRILSNTATTLTLDDAPVNGKYVVLPDFSEIERPQENYEIDIRTEIGPGFIKNVVTIQNNTLVLKSFEPGELANMIFKDGADNRLIIKNNTADTIFFYEDTFTPTLGAGMSVLDKFFDSIPLPYIDTFRNDVEAAARSGSRLQDNHFYYYTIFTKPLAANVAQAEFGNIDSGTPTQSFAISTKDRMFGDILYGLWPTLHRELDSTGDLEDLMKVFGFQLNEVHALIDTYKLQDSDNVLVSALLPLSEQTGLPSVGFSIGADTLRRIAGEMISCWRLKGSKEGIALFIRVITTWDVTNGTADFGGSIIDFLPNVSALRFFDPNLGSLNVRLTQTDPFVAGGRFAKSLPGIVIPGFFTFREFVVTLPNIALYVGTSEGFSVGSGTTTMTDTNNNFGANDSLVGNFLLPNSEEVNDIFEIVANTATTITVRGVINNRVPGGSYAVLSPLNTNRFIILNRLLPVYIPFGTRAGFLFTITP
jgi:hypothetical protein